MAARDLAAIIRAKDEATAEIDRARASLTALERQFEQTNRAAASSTGGVDSFLGGVGKIAAGVGVAELALRGLEEAKKAVFDTSFGTNASLETAELQFEILMGDADKAKAHVKDLFDFAKATPFESEPIIKASRILEVFGGSALNTKETLRLVGDAAAGATAPIEEVGMWVARAYSAIQSGRPFGEAAQRLQELGLLSGESRARIEDLSEAGAESERVWAAFTGELGRFSGSMDKLQGTWVGLTSTASDSINLLLSGALKPLFDSAKEGLTELNKVLETDEAKRWGEALSDTLKTDVIPALKETAGFAGDVASTIRNIPGRTQPAEQGGGPDIGGMLFRSTLGRPVLLKEQAGDFIRDIREMNAIIHEGLASVQGDIAAIEQSWNSRMGVTGPARDDWRLSGKKAVEALAEGVGEGADEAERTVSGLNFASRLAQAFRLGDSADELGDGGAELMKALADGIEKNTDKTANTVEQAARKIMERWNKELDPAEARARGAALRAALEAGLTDEAETQLKAGQRALDAKKEAADLKKAQEEAVREAKRIADEWRRTMPITGENFASELAKIAGAVSFGPGRGLFEGITKAIEDGGEQSIQAVGRMAAEMAQKMRDEFGPEDGEAWAQELIRRINQAIADGSTSSRQAVGEWVKAFDIESQLRKAGERGAIAVNEAIQTTQAAIQQAQDDADKRIARIRADAALAQARDTEREGLQRDFDRAIAEFQNAQRSIQMDRGFGREDRDTDIRRAREELLTQQSADKQATARATAERKAQEAIDAAKFRGDTLGTIRAMKAKEDQGKVAEDQIKEAKRLRDQQRAWEDEDRDRRRQDARDDFAQAITDAETLQKKREELMGPLKEFAERIRGEDIDRSIQDVLDARDQTIGNLNQRLDELKEKTQADLDMLREKLIGVRDESDTIFDGAVAQAERLVALMQQVTPGGLGGSLNEAAAAEAQGIGQRAVKQKVTIQNYGIMGQDAIDQLTDDLQDEALSLARSLG